MSTPNEQLNASPLYCLHIPGPDEVHAAPNKAEAEAAARAFNAIMRKHLEGKPYSEFAPSVESCLAVVKEWPFDADEHADALAEWNAEDWGVVAPSATTTPASESQPPLNLVFASGDSNWLNPESNERRFMAVYAEELRSRNHPVAAPAPTTTTTTTTTPIMAALDEMEKAAETRGYIGFKNRVQELRKIICTAQRSLPVATVSFDVEGFDKMRADLAALPAGTQLFANVQPDQRATVEVVCYWPDSTHEYRQFDHWPDRNELPSDAVRFDIAWPYGVTAATAALGRRAARDVLAERQRQVSIEGWTPEHDDEHEPGSMACAGLCYAMSAADTLAKREKSEVELAPRFWPWHESWWKPSTPRRDLVKAGALILAEIERLDRAAIAAERAARTDVVAP